MMQLLVSLCAVHTATVDHVAGNIEGRAITEGEDLTHAKSQKAAMDKAKIKLTDAAEKAKGNVVSAVPERKASAL